MKISLVEAEIVQCEQTWRSSQLLCAIPRTRLQDSRSVSISIIVSIIIINSNSSSSSSSKKCNMSKPVP